MDRADATGMAGAPGLQEVEGFRAANLADGDAVRPQSQGRAHEIGERSDIVFGAQCDQIRGSALQFARVLYQDNAVFCLGDFGQESVRECRFAGGGATGNEDVAAVRDCNAQDINLCLRHDFGGDVIVQRKDSHGGFANCKCGRRNDGWQKPLEPLSRFGEFSGHAWCSWMRFSTDMMGDQPDNTLRISMGHAMIRGT